MAFLIRYVAALEAAGLETLAIEPMVNLGHHKTKTLSDGWTVVAADGSPSAHFEHTVLTTDRGPEILTLPRPLTAPFSS